MKRFIFFAVVMCVGTYLRLAPAWHRDFPINDGGMWIAFSTALAAHWPKLPETFVFNGGDAIAAYPPAAAYLMVLLSKTANISFFTIEIWLPAILSILALLAFAFFVTEFWRGRANWIWSLVIFAIMINAFRWFIMGGGVPRGIGLIAQLCCWAFLLRAQRTTQRLSTDSVFAGCCAGVAILSHPTAALWSVLGVIFLNPYLNFSSLLSRTITLLVAALVASPWIFTVLARFGLTPYLNAFSEGQQSLDIFANFALTPTEIFAPHQSIAIFGVIGLAVLVKARDFRLPLIFLAGLVCDPRGLTNLHGVPVLAMLMGCGVEFIFNALSSVPGRARTQFALVAILFLSSLHSVLLFQKSQASYLTSPSPADLAFIRDLSTRFPERQSLLVFSTFEQTGDGFNEWIATLTPHESVTMHQGREWSGDFIARQKVQLEIERCCRDGRVECVERVQGLIRDRFEQIVVAPECRRLLGTD